MSDLMLRTFGSRAEELVAVPDFDEIERRGARRAVRRRAGVAGLVAAALVITGYLAGQQRDPRTDEPVRPPQHGRALAYPGATMEDIEPGHYELQPRPDGDSPKVRFTVPAGWNSWVGPNRFAGLDDPSFPDNEAALADMHWYVGVLYLDVRVVSNRRCDNTIVAGKGPRALVRALSRASRLRLRGPVQRMRKFGYPSTYLPFREGRAPRSCTDDYLLTEAGGDIGYAQTGSRIDAWVVEVGDTPLLVLSVWTPNVPAAELEAQRSVLASTEIVLPETDD